jgi:hypothetical protein
MPSLADLADADLDADRAFFARNPDAMTRTRRAFTHEREEAFAYGQPRPPSGCDLFVTVTQIAPGLRARQFFIAEAGAVQ